MTGVIRGNATSDRGKSPAVEPHHPVSVIESKFHPPPLRPGTVSRRVVVDRVRRSPARVAAIVAPAGYGKTTLLREWSQIETRPVVWLSTDGRDNDPIVFLAHLAVAIDRVEPLDRRVFAALSSPGVSVVSTVLPRLASAFASITQPIVLLLDDVHHLVERACLDAIAELAERLPPGSQLAITSRTAPAMPLARLRANGALVEIGTSDLALDRAQARSLLRDAGVDLPDDVVTELTQKTEGWPTGLYLAAHASLATGDVGVRGIAFTGDDRFVTDYVRSEILARLPGVLVRFLTRTAVLDRMSGSLCDAVLRQSGSARVLALIEDSNLLLVPLDRRRAWYRYHHLFRDVLMTELTAREPELVPTLHRRAARWLEENGHLDEAIDHAHAGGEDDRTAVLFERMALSLHRQGRFGTLLTWLDRFDDAFVERHPGVAVLAAWTAALTGDAIGAGWWADVLERSPATAHRADLAKSSAPASALHIVRALTSRRGIERMRDDAEAAVHLEAAGSPWRPAALVLYGVGTILGGDEARADGILTDAIEAGERAGARPVTSVGLAERSLLAMNRGDWSAASAFAQQARATIDDGHLEDYVLSSITFAVAARTALHVGDVDVAREAIVRSQRLRPMLTSAIPWLTAQTMVELARVQLALADRAGAWASLADAREAIARLPDLGTLGDQVVDLQRRLRQLRAGSMPGPTALTPAELRLLPYLPTHLSFREIGERLHVSPNTVKTQAISIYRKLTVSSRADAVAIAQDIGLLET